MNLNHWCDPDPDRNYFPITYDPDGRRFDHNHVDHSNCSGLEILWNPSRPEGDKWDVVYCECPCHKD